MKIETQQAASPIGSLLEQVHLAPRQAHKGLTLYPLVADVGGASPLRTLAEALEAGDLDVDEVDEAGSVPHVRVTNRGVQDVLVLFGEELVGAKQNRVANATFVVPAHTESVLDVSCVEAGRWHRPAGQRFAASQRVIAHHLRRRMARHVARSRRLDGSFRASQGEVWDDVRYCLDHAGASSRTEAYADYWQTRTRDLEEMEKAFRPVARQVGFVAMVGDEVEGVELVGHPALFAGVFQQLLRAYLIDAVDAPLARRAREGELPRPVFDAPEPFLALLAAAPRRVGPSLGRGEDVRLTGDQVSGCALVVEEHAPALAAGVAHLMAWPHQADETDRGSAQVHFGWDRDA